MLSTRECDRMRQEQRIWAISTLEGPCASNVCDASAGREGQQMDHGMIIWSVLFVFDVRLLRWARTDERSMRLTCLTLQVLGRALLEPQTS